MSDWTEWSKTASKGDVIRLATYQRAASIKLAVAISDLARGNVEDAKTAITAYFEADAELSALIDETGGRTK